MFLANFMSCALHSQTDELNEFLLFLILIHVIYNVSISYTMQKAYILITQYKVCASQHGRMNSWRRRCQPSIADEYYYYYIIWYHRMSRRYACTIKIKPLSSDRSNNIYYLCICRSQHHSGPPPRPEFIVWRRGRFLITARRRT